MYLIISLKHTYKHEECMTLWRSNNSGYTLWLEQSGQYENYTRGYHDSEGNIPIDQDTLNKLDLTRRNNEFGEPITFISNTPYNHKILGVKYSKKKLIKL